jgi:PAT family beta-lactamase induction signal transducer AmpG
MTVPARPRRWRDSIIVYRDRRMAFIFFFGMASGLPSSLVFATLSIWLREEGLSRTAIGLLGIVATPYAINFLWAPLVDRLRLPALGALGQRRAWILSCQIALCVAVVGMGLGDPIAAPIALAAWAVAVAFLSATQDIAIDAYRVETLEPEQYGAGAALAVYGWHMGAFLSGAGVLYIAEFHGWSWGYGFAAGCLALTTMVTLLAPEPAHPAEFARPAPNATVWLREAAIEPLVDFVRRLGWVALLVIVAIILYKFGDAMLGRMTGTFYVDLGLTKIEIVNYTKTVGLAATLLGVFMGGIACARFGTMRALMLGAVLMMITNLAFALLALYGKEPSLIVTVVFFDNLTGGMATSAFVAYLSGLCNVAFTATQYALLASLGNIARIQLGAISGWAVDSLGGDWALFFVLVAATSLPSLAVLAWMLKRFPVAAGRG